MLAIIPRKNLLIRVNNSIIIAMNVEYHAYFIFIDNDCKR